MMNGKALSETDLNELRESYRRGESITNLSLRFNISRPTVYRAIDEDYSPRSSNLGYEREKKESLKEIRQSIDEIEVLLKDILYVLKECDLHVKLEEY